MDEEKIALIPDGSDFVSGLCDSDSLAYALKQIDERERFVILARVLEEKSFEEIADKLGLKYKGVAAIYYRGIAKLRDILKGEL
jgi:RNA polymerase sigma factor (sigma-70 family)